MFVSEIHYDNAGTDTGEAIEVQAPAGTDLTGWSVVLYNGSNGEVYGTAELVGAAPDSGVVVVERAGIQNGSPDGLALVDSSGSVVEFLSYEGTMTAVGGAADGMTSTDIGVQQPGDTPIGESLQRIDGTWTGPLPSSFGRLNGTADPEPATVVINEFSASTTGTDVEFLEVLGAPDTDYGNLHILEVEGDADSASGAVDEAVAVGATDAEGRWYTDLEANTLENGTMTLLLVEGYAGQTDLDVDGDGVLDAGTGITVIDSVAVHDGGTGDLTYSETVLVADYDGLPFAPGGASRIPDGTDTDSVTDWVRNDFDLAGIEGYEGSLVEGEAVNTPGRANTTVLDGGGGDPGDPVDVCEVTATPIGKVQGSGEGTPLDGQTVTIRGTVVGDFQDGGFDGYFVQDAGDDKPATSDGIFVYARGGAQVSEGDLVTVVGTAGEYEGQTQLSGVTVEVCDTGTELPTPTELSLPVDDHEAYEGMLVTFPQDLSILEYFNYGRYGELALGLGDGTDRQYQPTAVYEPGSGSALALLEYNAAHRITLDDGRSWQNPDPLRHPNGQEFSLENSFRGGDTLSDVTGILDYRFDDWRVQPTVGAVHTVVNERPEVPEVGGTTTVASFNVLNYFTTLESRGADTVAEFERQEAKIVAAINEMDADVVGLIEIENNGDVAVGTLVDALNEAVGEDRWAFISTGTVGTDAITTAFIYQPAEVTPVGDFAVLDSSVDERFNDEKNRPALAQTFEENLTGAQFTVVNNHLKSKGSDCDDLGDPDTGDGAGNCNLTRAAAADALGDWANSDPTGTGTEDVLIIGDLNSYDKEDPIDALEADGFVDMLALLQGEYAYSYVFDGMLGYLDYAMASASMLENVTGAAAWAINADEPSVIDYDMSYKKDAQDALFAPDPYRSSDHDPVIVGLDLDVEAPEVDAFVEPPHIWPANGKWRNVTTVIDATDNLDEDLTITLVGAEASEGGKVEVVDDARFRVLAVLGAEYTFTYDVTDDSDNTTTVTLTVTVEKPGKGKGLDKDKPGAPGRPGGR
ncbi:ExeM/NucH family extracellular endonuclease [Ornithinimicrobium kibberense]|uniref:ExeM/NucH family extracellular endonuclease n=2 Tax=Ornithinimicrobium kibberense TaxID=282060 RepID=A0ABV5V211_9MICO|nr:ExeM/NucH family extracellular endonuclease [Ornithinimicrobium kibberense]